MNLCRGEKSMKEYVDEFGGYFACSFAKDGRKMPTVLVRADSAKDARRRLQRTLGCVLAAFTARAVCP